MMATGTGEFVTDMFKQASETFNQTMQTGIQFQEQATKFWTETFGKGFDQFRSQFDRMAKDAIPAAKKNLEQFHNVFDTQAKKSFEALRHTFEVGQGMNNMQDAFEQTSKMWRNSFDAMRSNVDTMAKTNVEMFENFCEIAGRCCETNGHKSTATKAPSAK